MIGPTLDTARLVLRPMTMADYPAYFSFVSGTRTQYMNGPHDVATAWHVFCGDVAQWPLKGMGGLVITKDGVAVGTVGLCQPPDFPEPELGWFLYDGAEGQGIVIEAAAALRDWGLGPRGLSTMVSNIDPDNQRSIRVAGRLGSRIDPLAATPGNGPTEVWRHVRRAA